MKELKVSYQKHYGNNGAIYNQTIVVYKPIYLAINECILSEIKMGYPNYKHYTHDLNNAKLYLEPLKEGITYLNLTTTKWIKWFLSTYMQVLNMDNNQIDRIKTDRNTILKTY